MKVQFKDITPFNYFDCNGNEYLKVSTRTARLLSINKVFYFKQNTICIINKG